MDKKIAVIIGSTRPGRIGENISKWVISKMPQAGATYELIDLAQVNLPMFNEPMPPMMGQYQFDYTKDWSAKISGYDCVVIVSPEYNAGYPAVLKNAIDYLCNEWKEKPVSIVSYGYTGGASANNQLKEVFVRLNSKVTATLPTLFFSDGIFGADYQITDIDTAFAKNIEDIAKAGAELLAL
jgi:NAD(P)H-dependent FMN reductase